MSDPRNLTTDPNNANRGTARGRGMVERSLQRYGAGRSIVVDKHGTAIAGNTTLEIARELGIPVEVIPSDGNTLYAIQRTDLDLASDVAAMELGIADNRSAEVGLNWSVETLDALMHAGADTDQFWFPEEMASLYPVPEEGELAGGNDGNTDPDDVPETPETPTTRPGDLWLLGKHRLICGDSTDARLLDRVMDGKRADMVLTDPPYGMRLDTDWSTITGSLREGAKGTSGNTYAPVIGDDEDYDPRPIMEYFAATKEQFWFGADYYAERIPNRCDGSWMVWDKRKESQADGIGSEFELCWSRQRHKRRMLRHDWFGFLSSENRADAQNRVHPTQKPVSLLVDLLSQWGKEAQIVADPYGGSGSTLMACERIGTSCRMVEVSPAYCDIIVRRWEAYTGLKAVLSGDGGAPTDTLMVLGESHGDR